MLVADGTDFIQWDILNHTSLYWESLDPCIHIRLEFDLVQDMERCQKIIGTENENVFSTETKLELQLLQK
jgi:hypothetical protein